MSRLRSALPGLRQLAALRPSSIASGQIVLQQAATSYVRGLIPQSVPALPTPVPFWSLGPASRSFATSDSAGKGPKAQPTSEAQDLVTSEEEFDAITDKIPQQPVGIVEGTSYSIIILAALGFAAAVLYAAVSELLLQPAEFICFNKCFDRIKDDPRVTVRLGEPVHAYGTESRNRAARQHIPHRLYDDSEGRQHMQLQFHLTGPRGYATVNADMFMEDGEWKHNFLYLDVHEPQRQQVVLIRPEPVFQTAP